MKPMFLFAHRGWSIFHFVNLDRTSMSFLRVSYYETNSFRVIEVLGDSGIYNTKLRVSQRMDAFQEALCVRHIQFRILVRFPPQVTEEEEEEAEAEEEEEEEEEDEEETEEAEEEEEEEEE